MDFISIIIFLGIVQGFFVGILLLTLKRGNIQANRLLGMLMMLFSISISGFEITRTHTEDIFLFVYGIAQSVIFLFGPLFYFYVLALTRIKYKITPATILHFVPFLINFTAGILFTLRSSEQRLSIIHLDQFTSMEIVLLSLQIFHLYAYMFVSKKILKEHELKIRATLSSLENLNLTWLKSSIFIFEIIFGMCAVFMILAVSGVNGHSVFNVIIPICVSFVILGMSFAAFRHPIIFPVEEESHKVKKYEWSTLTDERAEEALIKLKFVMEQEKVYLNSGLTLQKLAEALKISPQHLSQIINERMNQNFFDFVNCYRIKEAKRILVDPRGELLTILAVAEEVGFNSKSSFNAAFKKITGMTPTEYKKTLSAIS